MGRRKGEYSPVALPSLLPPSHHLHHLLGWRHHLTPQSASTGLPSLDSQIGGGLPRGRITELTGPPSSGRTTLLHSLLATAGARGEFLALIDAANSFDPLTASAAGVPLSRLLWIRCASNLEHALHSADLIIQSGGFQLVALDFSGFPERALSRIPTSYWFRFRRAIEPTSVCLTVLADRPLAKSCASLWLESRRAASPFQSALVLSHSRYEYLPRKSAASTSSPVSLHVPSHDLLSAELA